MLVSVMFVYILFKFPRKSFGQHKILLEIRTRWNTPERWIIGAS